jgi:arylsulfatase A-like enzyme
MAENTLVIVTSDNGGAQALTGKAELNANRPLFFRRRTISLRKDQNVIRQSAVRQGDWKYLRTYSKRDSSKFTASLYNLKDDIAEEKNLSASSPEKLKALGDLLDEWELEMSKTSLRSCSP